MDGIRSSRRKFIQATAGVFGAGSLSQFSLAAPPDRIEVNVGHANTRGRRAAEKAASEIHREFAFDARTIEIPRKALDGLSNNPNIRYVEENATVQAVHHKKGHSRGNGKGEDTPTPTPTEAPTSTPTEIPTDTPTETPTNTPPSSGDQTLPWGIDRIDADVAHSDGNTGSGVDIAILDTGIDSDHPDLSPNIGSGKAVVAADNSYRRSWDDDNGHGTHCAGIAGAADNSRGVVGVAPDATLHAVKVLDQYGNGSYADIATGLEHAANQGWDVANLSLAGGKSSLMEDACEYAYGNGVLLVASARNYCSGCVGYPPLNPK